MGWSFYTGWSFDVSLRCMQTSGPALFDQLRSEQTAEHALMLCSWCGWFCLREKQSCQGIAFNSWASDHVFMKIDTCKCFSSVIFVTIWKYLMFLLSEKHRLPHKATSQGYNISYSIVKRAASMVTHWSYLTLFQSQSVSGKYCKNEGQSFFVITIHLQVQITLRITDLGPQATIS